jgi:hypothetical protein
MKNLDSTIKRILKEVVSEQMTANQNAALSLGYGPVSTSFADQLASQFKLNQQPTNSSSQPPAGQTWSVVQGKYVPDVTNTQSTTQTTTGGKFSVDYKFTYPGDNTYIYGYKDGKWYAKNKNKNTEFDLSSNSKYKSSVDNLNKKFGSQVGSTQQPATNQTQNTQQPATNQTQNTQQYQFDFTKSYNAVDNTYVKPAFLPFPK